MHFPARFELSSHTVEVCFYYYYYYYGRLSHLGDGSYDDYFLILVLPFMYRVGVKFAKPYFLIFVSQMFQRSHLSKNLIPLYCQCSLVKAHLRRLMGPFFNCNKIVRNLLHVGWGERYYVAVQYLCATY